MNKQYQPKGSMCANCQNVDRYCGCMNFESMPVMKFDKNTIIVKCTEFLTTKGE